MSSVIVPKIKSTKEKVIKLLESNVNYRNDDEKLVARYWWDELNINKEVIQVGIKSLDAIGLLRMYSEGKLTSADIITRARRKAQEKNPELRGSKWKKRHDEEKLVRDEINDKLPKHGGGYTP